MKKTFKIEAQIYTENSYPRAIWITTKVDGKNYQEALGIFHSQFLDNIQGLVSADITAVEIK